MRKVFIIYSGGTIGSKNSKKGLVPRSNILTPQLKKRIRSMNIAYNIVEMNPLVDSSDMQQKDWILMANMIANVYAHYDAFIILHGTDTMAYTASSLSFLFEHLNKPVILTGSQLPLFKKNSDGEANIINSLKLSLHNIPEVMICFGSLVLRGNRAEKIDTRSLTAFISPNFPPLGTINKNIKINQNEIFKQSKGMFKIPKNLKQQEIIMLRLMPGNNGIILNKLLELAPKAIMIGTFGLGNAPHTDKLFNESLKEARKRNIIVVDITQCLMGGTTMTTYKTGRALLGYGVISARDMTLEAVYGKIFYLLNKYSNIREIKRRLHQNLRGELSTRKTKRNN